METYPIPVERKLELAEKQGWRCAICRTKTTDLAVDHDHDTGLVRALLCRSCNTGIGFLNDNPTVVQAALDYLTMFKSVPKPLPTDEHVEYESVALCPGSYDPLENIATGPGPGIFSCPECGQTRMKKHKIGRYKNRMQYMAGAHLRPGQYRKQRGPAERSLRR